MRKKWNEYTKIQLGKLIQKQLDMNVSLNDAVSRAAEILQAPRSTCMNYWQKELKNLDYSREPVTLRSVQDSTVTRPYVRLRTRGEDSLEDRERLLAMMRRLRATEEKVRALHQQASVLLNDYTILTREMSATLEVQDQSTADDAHQTFRAAPTLDIGTLAKGDIVRIHHHIWQDFYYISSVREDIIYGYKLNRNMRIRRKSKEKMIPTDLLQFGRIVQRDVAAADVASE